MKLAWVPAGLYRAGLEPLPESVRVEPFPGVPPPPEQAAAVGFLAAAPDLAPALRELLPALPRLEVLQSLSAGVEWLLPLAPEGVTVCNASGVHDVPVSEWVLAAILTMHKRLLDWHGLQQEGRWGHPFEAMAAGRPPAVGPMHDLEGAKVLIVGYGSIGRAVAARLAPFGARVTGVARHPRPGVHAVEELDALLPEADIVVLLAPLTEETRGMVDEGFLARMRPGALLVNAARGGLVDHGALERALRAGRVRAALDVTDPEPLPDGHPLWSAPGLLITPHVAGYSERLRERALRFVREQLTRWATGQPLANVRREY